MWSHYIYYNFNMYNDDNNHNNNNYFFNIVVTLTTVGFGDVTP